MNPHHLHPACKFTVSPPRLGRGSGGRGMNFFQRRKILKKANYLHLRPVRRSGHEVREDGTVDILMPRFNNKFWSEVYRRSRKGEFIRIHLDSVGSALWLLIDGEADVEKISAGLDAKFPGRFPNPEDAEKKVTQFFTLLYHQDYITFREISGSPEIVTLPDQNKTNHQEEISS